MVGTEHAGDGPHLDAGRRHRDEEDGDAVLLALTLRRASQEEAPLRHGRIGRPDLLARGAPTVAIALGRRLQRRKIGARVRLAEALAPDDLAARDRRQVLLLLLGRAVPHDRRAHPVDAHVLRAAGLVMRPHLLAHDGLLPRRRAAAAVLLWPRHAQQALRGERAAEALGDVEVGGIVGERPGHGRPLQ